MRSLLHITYAEVEVMTHCVFSPPTSVSMRPEDMFLCLLVGLFLFLLLDLIFALA